MRRHRKYTNKVSDKFFIAGSILCVIFIIGMLIYDGKLKDKEKNEVEALNKKKYTEQMKKEEKRQELENEILMIRKEIKPGVLLNFDWYAGMYNDRYKLVKGEYGYNATFCLDSQTTNYNLDSYLTRAQFNEMIASGWDYAFYGGVGTYPGVDNVNNSSYKDAWNAFISELVSQKKNIGISTPVAYFSPNNACGNILSDVLKQNGFKLARTMSVEDSPYIKGIDENTIMTGTDCIRSTTLNDVKSHIDTAIQNGWSLPIFTHKLVDTVDEEANGMHCYKGTYIELLDYIKTKVDAGQLEVLTYKEYYEKMINVNNKISVLQKEIDELN